MSPLQVVPHSLDFVGQVCDSFYPAEDLSRSISRTDELSQRLQVSTRRVHGARERSASQSELIASSETADNSENSEARLSLRW